MPDPNPNPNPDPNPNPNPNPNPAPWHQGVEAETIGFWQNKGYKVDDPKDLATNLTKQYRELERHMGGGPDNLIRIPKPDAKPEDIKAFWGRLGTPAEAKDYDFSAIKRADGTAIEAPLADALRTAALAAHLPKDAASAIAAATVKHLDDARAAESAVRTAKIAAEKAELAKNWTANGQNFDFNHLKAMEGARRLGIPEEAIKLWENSVGYKSIMEAMRRIGAGTSEDAFVDGKTGTAGQVTTREGAIAKKAELEKNKDWSARYLKGGVQEKQEMDALILMIDGNE